MSRPEAGWIDTGSETLFAMFHAAKGPARPIAVLLCDPFGSHRMITHVAYREVARALSEAGFASLRVDYPGTCDSSGYPAEDDQVTRWLGALDAAADWLKERSGTPRLGVLGALLGGTLALELAKRREDVEAAALWGALPDGRAMLRELTAFQAMTQSNPGGRKPSTHREGDLEGLGFLINAQTAASLNGLKPLSGDDAIVERACVLRRNRTFPIKKIVARLESAGAEVYTQAEARLDLDELEKAPTPPDALLDELVAWWDEAYPDREELVDKGLPALLPDVELLCPTGDKIREEALRFGPDEALFGILSTPLGDAPRRPVVLVNAGTNHRSGINRNYTEWGRSLASQGHPVLRMDVRGLGDSDSRAVGGVGALYIDEPQYDVREAVTYLCERFGAGVICAGLCAGGYQALHTTLGDDRVSGLVLLNPLRLRRFTEAEGDAPAAESAPLPLSRYVQRALDPATWKRMREGQVDLKRIAGSLAERGKSVAKMASSRLRGSEPEASTWLAGALLSLVRRDTDVLMVFESSDGMREIVEKQIALDRARIDATGRLKLISVPDSDHIFAPLWSQEHVGELLSSTLAQWHRG